MRRPLMQSARTLTLCRLAPVFGLALILTGAPAKAGIVQFAQFTEANSNSPLTFTNNTTSASLAYNSATLVNFSFTTSSGLDTSLKTATLSLSGGPTTASATSAGGFIDQPLNSPLTIRLIEVGGPNPGANLLTMTFTGDITGRGPTGSIIGADMSGQNVTYTSDFLNFSTPGSSYTLGLQTLSTSLSIGAGGFLNSFSANVSGLFSGNVSVNPALTPEPASAAMCVIGLAAASAISIRRQRRLARASRQAA